MKVGFIVLVDDEVATSEWEQELYRMGVPPGVDVQFASVSDAAARFAEFQRDPRAGILLTGDIETMARLVADGAPIKSVNIGGVHHHPSRTQRLRYVFLTSEEEAALKGIADTGVTVTAQDVPAARVIALEDVLSGAANS